MVVSQREKILVEKVVELRIKITGFVDLGKESKWFRYNGIKERIRRNNLDV